MESPIETIERLTKPLLCFLTASGKQELLDAVAVLNSKRTQDLARKKAYRKSLKS